MKRDSTGSRSSASAPKPAVTRVIAVANQKGGVGKSTTAVSLGAALAELGYRVLVVDLDPQGNASTGLGIRHEARDVTVYDVLAAEAPIEGAVVETGVGGLFAIPSTIDLAGAEIELVSQFSREMKLQRALEPLRNGAYDFIFLDCPPSLGLLTVNALAAAEELIVPIQCEYYALEGLGQLLRNVRLVQQNVNPKLRLTGIVMTMFDSRTKLSEQVVAEVRRFFGERVYETIIPRTVRLSEAPGFGQPITVYDPGSKGADTYRALAREVAEREPLAGPLPTLDDLPRAVVSPPKIVAKAPVRLTHGDAADAQTIGSAVVEVEADGASTRAPEVGPVIEGHEPEPPAEPTVGDTPRRDAVDEGLEKPEASGGDPSMAEPSLAGAAPEVEPSPDPGVSLRSVDPLDLEPPNSVSERPPEVHDIAGVAQGEGWATPGVEAEVEPERASHRLSSVTEEPPAPQQREASKRKRWRLFRRGGDA